MRWMIDDEDDSIMFSPADVAGGLGSINILEERNTLTYKPYKLLLRPP